MCRAFFINRLLGSVNNNQYVLYNNSICAASLEKGQLQRVNKLLIWLKPTAEHCFDTINGGDSSKSRHKLCPCNRAAQEGVTQLRPWVSAPLVLMGNDICHRHSIEVLVASFFFFHFDALYLLKFIHDSCSHLTGHKENNAAIYAVSKHYRGRSLLQ